MTPGEAMALLDDSVVAWGLLTLTLAVYALAPDSVRERWWAALTRRSS